MEVSLTGEQTTMAPVVLARLQDALRPHHPTIVADDGRYSVVIQVAATTAADALFSVSARWNDAARTVSLPAWELVRAEVITVEEFEREQARDPGWAAATDPSAVKPRDELGDELLLAEELLDRALRDSLTGLVTRELFTDRVRSVLADDAAAADEWVVLDVDLDQFSAVNRDGGAAVGDRVLAVLAARLCEVPGHDLVARLGGDEFAVLLHVAAPSDADAAASRSLEIIRAPIKLEGRKIAVTASVGVASSAQMTHPDDLVREAGEAMCQAKADGGNCARRFEARVGVDVRRLDFDSDSAPDRWANVLLLERAALAANECETLEEAAAIVLQQVCAHTGWPLGHLSVVNGSGDSVVPTAIWHTGGPDRFQEFRRACEAGSAGPGEGVVGKAVQTGQFTCGSDMAGRPALPAAMASIADTLGIKAWAVFPILVGREVVALLEFYCSGQRRSSDSLREVMKAVCAQLSRVAERSRSQVALARSEEKYRTLADSVPVLMWMTGPDSWITTLNREWLEFTGRSQREELRDCWVACVHPDDLERCNEAYRTAFALRQPFQLDYRLRRADGEYRIISGCGRPIGSGESFQGFVGAGVDVTDRRRAEAAVHHSEARFRALLGHSRAIVTLVGADGRVIADYQGATLGMGYPEGSTAGRLSFEFLHPDDMAAAMDAFALCLECPGISVPFQCRVRHADGPWRWVDAVGTNRLDYPPVEAIIVTAVDVSERKALEQRLAAAEERLRQTSDLAVSGLEGWDAFVSEGSLSE